MTTLNEVCRELGINVTTPGQDDLDKLSTYCQVHVSQDHMFYGDIQQMVKQCSDYIQSYLEIFLPNVCENDLCSPVLAFNNVSSLEYMTRQGFDRYLSRCHPIGSQINTLFGLMSPLHIAATYGYKYTTIALLMLGANAKTANKRHELPIHYALDLPVLHNEQLVAAKQDVFINLYNSAPETLAVPMEDGATILHKMACYGYSELLSNFINKLPGLALKINNFGKLPIHSAILNGQLATIKVLIKSANPNDMVDFQNRNPLHYAAAFANVVILAECLSAFKDNIQTKDKQGRTPLMLAAYYGNLPNLEMLLDVDSNSLLAKDNYGNNALQIAIDEQQIEVVERLRKI